MSTVWTEYKKQSRNVILQPKIKLKLWMESKRYLKVSVNVTQLCYSLVKLVCLHGDLEVLGSHQTGVRAGHIFLSTNL